MLLVEVLWWRRGGRREEGEGLTHFARVLFFLCTSGEFSSSSFCTAETFLFIASARVTAKCQVECQLSRKYLCYF